MVTTRRVKDYEQFIDIRRDCDKQVKLRCLFGGLRSLCKHMMDEGYIMISYYWKDEGDDIFFMPDLEWHTYSIRARVLYVGKKRVKDRQFRYMLRHKIRADIYKN